MTLPDTHLAAALPPHPVNDASDPPDPGARLVAFWLPVDVAIEVVEQLSAGLALPVAHLPPDMRASVERLRRARDGIRAALVAAGEMGPDDAA